MATLSAALSPAVRVEDEFSLGRSYSTLSSWREVRAVPGLGAQRRALTSRSFQPYADGAAPVLEAATMSLVNLRAATRADVLAYFRNTWALTDTLFSALATDASFYMVPDKLRRPLIFYFGHPAALYINKMHQAGLVDHINVFYQKLFETGVDEMSWDDMDAMQDEDFEWPDVADVQRFRCRVKAAVEACIATMPEPSAQPVTQDSPWWALFLAFEHDKIHLETSSVLMRQLPVSAVRAPPGWRTAPSFAAEPASAPPNALVDAPAAHVSLGKPRDFPSFGWDNEYGSREVDVPAFAAAARLCSNGEFHAFVAAGGYAEKRWWVSPAGDDEGWRWRTYRNATHPSFWVASAAPDMARFIGGAPAHPYQKDDGNAAVAGAAPGEWRLRAQFEVIPMPWDWPVEVNYLEAAAFLRWKGAQEGAAYRLPTEAEHHVARGRVSATAGDGCGGPAGSHAVPRAGAAHGDGATAAAGAATGGGADDEAAVCADVIMAPSAPGNVNWRWHSPTPVDFYAPSPTGFHDTHGSVWEWVEDHFAPFPNFEIHYLYDDFSTPCFDGWHTMILGGSWVSSGNLASSFARYHFRRHFFQHLGFRYVRVDAPEPFPGAATALNLWEGGSRALAKDLTDGFAPPAARAPFPLDLISIEAAMSYPAAVATLLSRAYAAHVGGGGGGGGGAGAARVLHIGCGTGAATFELCRSFGAVVGVDASEPLIRHARVLQHHGQFGYDRVTEGMLTASALVRVPEGAPRGRATFVVGDACALAPEVLAAGPYAMVLLDMCLTSLRQPQEALAAAAAALPPGGILVVTSHNAWSAERTPRNSWLGGFLMNGEPMSTLHMLGYALARTFALVETADLLRCTQSTERRLCVDIVQATIWKRKE